MKKILISGNEAVAEGALAAGCRFYAGYPITPQNELIAYMAQEMPKRGGIFLQSESEIAAINMVYGAAASGAMAMTSSSSPGISLKQEGLSYLAGTQVPAVVVNVMRAGPGLGNVWPAQSDYFQATKGGGHGDYRMIVLAPSSIQECFDLTRLAFELSGRYRIVSMLLLDGILGQMMEPLEVEDQEKNIRLVVDHPWTLSGAASRPPRVICSLFLERDKVEKNNLLLQKKYARIRNHEARFDAFMLDDAKVALVAYGSMGRMCQAAVLGLRKKGLKVGLFRPKTLWPFPQKALEKLHHRIKKFFVVEMSYGQMVEDVRLSVGAGAKVGFYGRGGGGVPTQHQIEREVEKYVKKS